MTRRTRVPLERPNGHGDIVERTEAFAVIRERVMQSAANVRRGAVLERARRPRTSRRSSGGNRLPSPRATAAPAWRFLRGSGYSAAASRDIRACGQARGRPRSQEPVLPGDTPGAQRDVRQSTGTSRSATRVRQAGVRSAERRRRACIADWQKSAIHPATLPVSTGIGVSVCCADGCQRDRQDLARSPLT